MHEAALQTLAVACSLCGMAWLALAMDVHWSQVCGVDGPARGGALRLRVLGTAAIVASLALCLAADHASIAVLAWIMSLVVAAFAVAAVLASRPRWLAWLARIGG